MDALEACDQFFGQGLAGLGPEQTAGDAAVLLNQEGEGEEFFDILLDVYLGFFVERIVLGGVGFVVGDPGGVEAEVDEQVAVLLVSGVVKVGAEAEDAYGVGAKFPWGVAIAEGRLVEVWVGGLGVEVVDVASVVQSAIGGVRLIERPELPAHLEFVGHVVVELLGGFPDGGFDGGIRSVCGGVDFSWADGGELVGVDVDSLVGGCLGEVDGVGGRRGDTLGADQGKLAEHADQLGGKGFQAEVVVPEAEIQAICHHLLF